MFFFEYKIIERITFRSESCIFPFKCWEVRFYKSFLIISTFFTYPSTSFNIYSMQWVFLPLFIRDFPNRPIVHLWD